MHTDWQTLATWAIGAVALAYVGRRWWPGLIGLFHASPASASTAASNSAAAGAAPGTCGQANAPAASGSCGSGCGNCGQATTPKRDHSVRIVRHTAD